MRRIDFEIQTSFIIPAKLARVGVGGRHVTIATALVGWGRSGALGRNAVSVLLLLFSSPSFSSFPLYFFPSSAPFVAHSFLFMILNYLPPIFFLPVFLPPLIESLLLLVLSLPRFLKLPFFPHPRVFVLFRVSYPTYFHISVSEI